MELIKIIGVTTDGKAHEDFEAMNRFVTEINKFYSLFNWKFEFEVYKGTLTKNTAGKYSVAGMQSDMVRALKGSLMCFLVAYCKRDEADDLAMAALLNNLSQQKKTEFVAYYMVEDNNAIRGDISRRVAAKNETTPVYREDRERLSGIAKQILNQGCIFDREGNAAAANALFQQSLAINRKLVLSEPEKYLFDLALPYHNLGSLSLRSQNPALATRAFNDAIDTRMKAEQLIAEGKMKVTDDVLMRERTMMAGEFTQLGQIYVSAKENEKASASFTEAVKYHKMVYEAVPTVGSRTALADAYGNLAVFHNQEDHLQEAIENFSPMFELLKEQIKEEPAVEVKKKLGMCGNSLGILYMRQQKWEAALDVFEFNYQLYQNLMALDKTEYEPPMALVCFNASQVLRNLRKPEDAAFYGRQAQAIAQRRKDDNATCKRIYEAFEQELENAKKRQVAMAEQVASKADELRAQAKYNEAADLYRQAAGLYGGLGDVDSQLKMASLYDEIAVMLWDYVQLDQAEAYFKQSIAIYRAIAAQDETKQAELCVALFNVGRFIEDTKDKSLNSYFKEAYEIAKKFKDVNEKALEIYENLEEIGADLENYKSFAEQEAERAEEVAKSEASGEIAEMATDEHAGSENGEADTEETSVAAATSANENAEEKAPQKKGLFSRLFGKK